MSQIDEMPIAVKTVIEDLIEVLTPKNNARFVEEFAAQQGQEVSVSDEVGLSLGLIDQIYESTYLQIRSRLNAAFKVGDFPEFDGYFAEDTEFGDLTDTFNIIFKEQFSKPFGRDDTISFDMRRKWRDALLTELDEMVGR